MWQPFWSEREALEVSQKNARSEFDTILVMSKIAVHEKVYIWMLFLYYFTTYLSWIKLTSLSKVQENCLKKKRKKSTYLWLFLPRFQKINILHHLLSHTQSPVSRFPCDLVFLNNCQVTCQFSLIITGICLHLSGFPVQNTIVKMTTFYSIYCGKI